MLYMPSLLNDNTWNDFFGDDFFRTPTRERANLMKTDIQKVDGKYQLDIELPGYKKEDVELALEKGYLKVHASTNTETGDKNEDGKWIRRERYSGTVERSFYVGEQVTEEDVTAKFEDGVLTITVPDEENQKQIPEKKLISIA